jgi:hypothetical protein
VGLGVDLQLVHAAGDEQHAVHGERHAVPGGLHAEPEASLGGERDRCDHVTDVGGDHDRGRGVARSQVPPGGSLGEARFARHEHGPVRPVAQGGEAPEKVVGRAGGDGDRAHHLEDGGLDMRPA